MPIELIGVPSGFRDVLFEEARKRRGIEQKLAEVLDRHGYNEVVPSSVEYAALYTRGNQSVRNRLLRFIDRDDSLLALRADFTPAIARIAASRLTGLSGPLRIWYCGNVFRRADPSRGAFQETSQVGAELVGANTAEADVETLSLAFHMLDSIGIHDIQIHINHAGILKGIVDALELTPDARERVRVEIGRKDGRGLSVRLKELGVQTTLATQLDTLSRCIGGVEVLQRAHEAVDADASLQAIGMLRKLAERLDGWRDHLVYDLAEIDEMEYYTGVMFTLLSPKLKTELGRGGRYDDLLAAFGTPMPAVGFSFSTEKLVELV